MKKSLFVLLVCITLLPVNFPLYASAQDTDSSVSSEVVADLPLSRCAEALRAKDTVIPAGLMECRAYLAVYLDEKGRLMYIENVYNDPRRLIQSIPIHNRPDGGCNGGAQCFVCIGSRCGCVC